MLPTPFTLLCQNAPPGRAGRVEKTGITPTLILPHQGGGESLVFERDAPCGSAGRLYSMGSGSRLILIFPIWIWKIQSSTPLGKVGRTRSY